MNVTTLQLLSVEDVSHILKISPREINRLCREGRLDHVKVSRKNRRFTAAMVEKYIAVWTVSEPEPAKRLDTKSSHRLRSHPQKGGGREKTEESGHILRKEIEALCR